MTQEVERNEMKDPERRIDADFDPDRAVEVDYEEAAPPEGGKQRHANDEDIQRAVDELIERVNGGRPPSHDRRHVRDMITAALKLIPDGRHTGELKLMAAATKELRYAYRVFGQYPEPHKVSIFGSARTPVDHPDYQSAREFGKIMAEAGWMVITGAGGGIMQAGHEGPGRAKSFGVAIRLPFEQETNEFIRGDDKLINFRYFFTRKLMFLSQSEAVVCFPGGYGTLDEAFETLTLIQTGKAPIVPLVLLDGEGGDYWTGFTRFVTDFLLKNRMVNEEDLDLYYHATSPADAAEHVKRFYHNYRSCRYIRDELVIRMNRRLKPESIEALNEEFPRLIAEGRINPVEAREVEAVDLESPRIAFHHTRRDYGLLRRMIDRINELPTEGESA